MSKAERIDGKKQEKLESRPSAYSSWHRTIGDGCFVVDVDWVEYREGRGVVALIDVTSNLNNEGHIINSKRMIWERTNIQREVLITMSKALNVPAYFVIHTSDLSMFHVHNLANPLTEYSRMDRYQYTDFIKSL